MKPHKFCRSIFSTPRSRIFTAAVLSTVLIISATFVSTPLLFSNCTKQDTIQTAFTAQKTKQIETPTAHQSKYGLTASHSQTSPLIQPIAVTHSEAVLSLSGTLGNKGWYITDVECSLYATGEDSEAVTTEYAFYNQGWTPFSEPFIVFEEGQTAIYYRVCNGATGFVGETKFQTVDIDKTPPNGTVLIKEGAKDASSTLVTLTLSVTDVSSGPTTHPPSGYIWGVPSGPANMRFSNDGEYWSPWEPIASEKTWNLETGAGTKTVYVQARDNAGLVSEPFSDTINLVTTEDSVAPVTKLTVNGKQNSLGVYTSAVAITLSATDDLSGVSLTEYSFDSQTWTAYTSPLPVYTQGQTTIYYRSHDATGNVESIMSHTITININEESDPVSPLIIYGIIASVAAGTLAIFFMRRKRRSRNYKLLD